MTTMPPYQHGAPSGRRLHWDGTVTAGNAMTALAFLFGVLGVWFRMESKVEAHSLMISQLQARSEIERDARLLIEKAIAVQGARQEAMIASQRHIETLLDALAQQMRRADVDRDQTIVR